MKRCPLYPLVVNTSFGLTPKEVDLLESQDWFSHVSDFFGQPVVWVSTKSYYQAFCYLEDILQLDISCVYGNEK